MVVTSPASAGPIRSGVHVKILAFSSLAAACAAALIVSSPATASAAVGIDGASAFTSNGTLKDGWNWVHQDTESATWTFNITSLASAKPGKVYLVANALVADRVDGGSGYSARGVRFTASCNGARQTLTVHLENPFRPIYDGNSLGIGQNAYGHSTSPLRLNRFDGCSQITIRVEGAFRQDRAIGFKQSSLVLGYS